MARFLAYVDAVPGRLYPLVPTLLELAGRGHEVTVKAGIDDVGQLRAVGLRAEPLAKPIERFEPDDWKARTRFGALMSGLRQFGERARDQATDLTATIAAERPDVLFVDEGSWGAAAAAERSGLPWAFSLVSPVPLTSRDAPPFGLGLRPRHDRLGRLRDRAARALTLGSLERIVARELNGLRAELGIGPFTTLDAAYLAADLVLAYTAEPFEYPRTDWPRKVRLVGPGLWEPPAAAPPWLEGLQRPLVLVTCSTLFQNDRRLADVACRAFADAAYEVVITTGDIDPESFSAPANVRIERFVPHAPVLGRAACVVCHAGMGITQKSLAHAVPVVAVPFGRDQPEVARRVEVAHAGVHLPARRLTPERLRASVEHARTLAPGARRIADAFRTAGGPVAAAGALEGLARPVAATVSPQPPAPDASGASRCAQPVHARRLAALAAVLVAGLAVPPPDAHAAYPGRNGLIAVVAAAPKSGGGARRIHLVRPDGTLVRRITCPGTCADLWPAWSPDGRRLAFNAVLDPGPAGMRVGVVRADGRGRRILPAPAPAVSAVAPTWSPDHARLAFGAVGFATSGIWTSDVRGRDVRRLAPSGDQPAWSTDGRIAYSAGGPPEIWRMNADGSDTRQLTGGSGERQYPEWSPDGRRIAYTRIARGRESIWVMRADGRNQRRLTAGAAPAWSPNGRRIAFERSGRLYVMRADGRAVRQIPYTPKTTDGRRLRLSLPDWQPMPRSAG